MPRAVWTGSISFGLVNIPVQLFPAVRDRTVRFHRIDRANGARVRQRHVNEVTGEDVPGDRVVRGAEVQRGRYVLVEDADLDALAPAVGHTMDLEAFIDLHEIDPVYFHGAYHVAPGDRAIKPYALLTAAMAESSRVAIARFVMRSRQHVAVLRVVERRLLMSLLVFADELTPADTIEGLETPPEASVSAPELTMARSLIDALTTHFEPTDYRDTYREQVAELIDRLAEGRPPETPPAPVPRPVADLTAALQASVDAARTRRSA